MASHPSPTPSGPTSSSRIHRGPKGSVSAPRPTPVPAFSPPSRHGRPRPPDQEQRCSRLPFTRKTRRGGAGGKGGARVAGSRGQVQTDAGTRTPTRPADGGAAEASCSLGTAGGTGAPQAERRLVGGSPVSPDWGRDRGQQPPLGCSVASGVTQTPPPLLTGTKCRTSPRSSSSPPATAGSVSGRWQETSFQPSCRQW